MKQLTPHAPAALNRRAQELVLHMDAFARRFLIRRDLDGGADRAVTRRELRVLGIMGERPAWTMSELARHIQCAMSGVTAMANRLVEKGLASRRRSDQDRRTVWVALTPEGRRWCARFRQMRLQSARGMLHALNDAEQVRFLQLMRKIGAGGPDGPAAGGKYPS